LTQINAAYRLAPTRWQMPFNPRRAYIIVVIGIATLVLSITLLAGIVISVW
jgi:hypothetical protein